MHLQRVNCKGVAHSAQALDMLDAADRQRLCALPLFVPHRRIAETASALGLSSLIVTGPGDEGIMQGLLGFFGA